MAGRSSDRIVELTRLRAANGKLGHMTEQPSVTPLVVPLDHIELGALDLWIEDQPGRKLSRPEAARRLINEALVGK